MNHADARWRMTYWEQRKSLGMEDQRANVEPEIIAFDPGGTVGEEKGVFQYIIWVIHTICKLEPVVDADRRHILILYFFIQEAIL